MMGMMQPRDRMGMPFDHCEGRIAYLKAELQITDAQTPAWNAFANSMRSGARTMKSAHEEMMKSGMPTTMPARMGAAHKMMSSRLGMMDRTAPNMKALYTVLSPAQRKSFDEMMPGPMGMM